MTPRSSLPDLGYFGYLQVFLDGQKTKLNISGDRRHSSAQGHSVKRTATALVDLFTSPHDGDNLRFDVELIEALCEDAIATGSQKQLTPPLVTLLLNSEVERTSPGAFRQLLVHLCEHNLDSIMARYTGRAHEALEKIQPQSEPPAKTDAIASCFLLMFREEGPFTTLISAYFATEGAVFLRQLHRSLSPFLRSVEDLEESSPRDSEESLHDLVQLTASAVLDFLWASRESIPSSIKATIRDITGLAKTKGTRCPYPLEKLKARRAEVGNQSK